MIQNMTFAEWVASLGPDKKKTRSFFASGGVVFYRDSMGQTQDCYGLNKLPNMVRCRATGMRVWAGECEECRDPDRNVAYVSAMGRTMVKMCNATLPRGHSQYMIQTDCIRVGRHWASPECLGKCVQKCPMSGKLCFDSEMRQYGDTLVSGEWLNEQRTKHVIQQHNYRPDEFVIPKGNEYAGIELEIESREDDACWEYSYLESARLLNENLGQKLFLKRDGSLVNGYEIVTHPLDWEDIRDLIAPMLDKVRDLGMRSHESGRCGLHVHLPRKSMSKLEIAKLVVLWNSDHEWVRKVSGRSGTKSQNSRTGQNYCKLERLGLMFNGGPACVNHYAAINTMNAHTVEFRSFRGTLNPVTFLARIGLCFLVRHYIKKCNINPSWEGFLRWLIETPSERKRFPESWALIAACAKKHEVLSESLRGEVGSASSKKSKSNPSRTPSRNQS